MASARLKGNTALSALYIPATEAIGRKVNLQGREGEIIGVVKDFHFSSLHNAVGPLVMFPQERFRKIFVKLPTGNISENLEKVRQVCGEIITHRPFEYQFLDQQYTSLYRAEDRMGSVALVFATLAIIIACLGLFGLVSFSAEQKKKEIGIRKVLGATVSGIVFLITRDFSKLIITAMVIGLPLSYWLLSSFWLSGFAYKTEIGFTPFVIAASACISIALGATGYQVLKASRVSPFETLRSE